MVELEEYLNIIYITHINVGIRKEKSMIEAIIAIAVVIAITCGIFFMFYMIFHSVFIAIIGLLLCFLFAGIALN